MAEKIKELLEKINREGVQEAEKKASDIEAKAKKEAERIVAEAEQKAKGIVEDAQSDAKKTKEATETALKQAARDMVLSLKGEVRGILQKVIAADTAKALSSEDMSAILRKVAEKSIESKGEVSDIKVLLKTDELDKVRSSFMSKLEGELKKGIEFRPSSNVNAGFSISFDKGKSFFDFTDEGLAEALGAYLNPELARLLK